MGQHFLGGGRYLERMLDYMPRAHRDFIRAIRKGPSIRNFGKAKIKPKCTQSYLNTDLTHCGKVRSKGIEHRVNTVPSWWRHQMETFSALLAPCAWNSPVTGEFPSQRAVTQSLGVFFDRRLNKQLSKQSWGWWFETPSCSLWRHCNVIERVHVGIQV